MAILNRSTIAWARLLPLLLIFIAPFALFPRPSTAPFLLAIPGLWAVRWVMSRRRGWPDVGLVRRTPLDLAIWLLAGMVLISLYVTYDIRVSAPKAAGLLFGIAVYYGFVEIASISRRALAWSVAVFLLAGLGVAALALVGTQWPGKFLSLAVIQNLLPAAAVALPGAEDGFHPNEVAGTLVWFIPLAVAIAWAAWRAARRAGRQWNWIGLGCGLAVAALGAVLLLTQSRGALAGLAVGLLVLLLLSGRRGRWAALAIGVVGMALAAWFGPAQITLRWQNNQAIQSNARLQLWGRAMDGIEDFPLTGMGLNTFRNVARVLYPAPAFIGDWEIAHAHNMLLQVGLDLGVPGLLAYVALLLLAGALLWSQTSGPDPWLRALAVGLLGGLVAHFCFGLTDAVALGAKPGVFFWALLGLAVAVWQHGRSAVASPPNPLS